MVRHEVIDPVRVSDLALRLSVEASRAECIAEIESLYLELGDLRKVAARLQVASSTLNAWVARVPELKAAIERVRDRRNPER